MQGTVRSYYTTRDGGKSWMVGNEYRQAVLEAMQNIGLSYVMLQYYCNLPKGSFIPKKYAEHVEYFKNYFRGRLRNPLRKQAELLAVVDEAQFLEVSKDTLRLTLNPQDKDRYLYGEWNQ